MSEIGTFGEDLPGLLIECVVDLKHPDRLLLHTWDGHRSATAPRVEHRGALYVPMQLESGLLRSIRFPPPSTPFGSTLKIMADLRDFLSTYVQLRPEMADLLVAFGLSTWVCDLMSVAPVLHLFGPESAVSQVLRLLACFCRRPSLLGDVDFGGLTTLPKRLSATLLINQRRLGWRVQHALLASNRRHFHLIHGKEQLDLYGSRAFSCEESLGDKHGLVVSISPAHNSLPVLTDSQERRMAQTIQSKLLHYRLVHYEKIRSQNSDTSAFMPEMREAAHSWLAPIAECPALYKSVYAEILRQSREAAGVRFSEPTSVVAEAALFFCHKPGVVQFYVGDLTLAVNALLRGRHEEVTLTAKKVGLLLRKLGIHGERVTEGYKITLSGDMRRRIHQLGMDYQVPTLDNVVGGCPDCRQVKELEQRQ